MTSDIETGPSGEYIAEAIWHAALCLQWQASDATEAGNGYPIDEDDWTNEIVDRVPYLTEAVTSFIEDEENWRLLQIAGSDAAQTGHDFILTANGHGAGFWDRGYDMPADGISGIAALAYRTVGDLLTANCKPYGSFDAEFALWGEYADGEEHCADEMAWLMVMNEIIVDDGMIAQYEHDTKEAD